MNPQQTKFAIAGAVILAVLGGTYALNRTASDKSLFAWGDSAERGGVDVRQSRMGLSGRGGGSSGSGSGDADSRSRNGRDGADGSDDYDPGLASIVDVVTTSVMPIETEAETRERERYEAAQANKFKYRELDPERIQPVELTPALTDVSEEYQIPDNLLAALMYVESGGSHRDGGHSIDAGYGVMNLRENNMVDTLAEAASLVGMSKEEVLYDQGKNIKAAGALLRSYYDDALASGLSDSEAWYSAVTQYSGISDPVLASHIADEAAAMLLKGFEVHSNDGGGDVIVPPSTNPPFLPKDWDVVGMLPPTADGGFQIKEGTIPPNAQGYNSPVGDLGVTP